MEGRTGERGHAVKVILNADDLGQNEKTNAVIFELISRGRVTSASLLANGSAFEDAALRVRDFPRVSFGVHLNLTEGFPLTTHPGLAAILNPDGTFRRERFRRLYVDESLRGAVLAEWTAQVEKAVRSGVPVSHFDGHHHTHTATGLFLTLKALQRRFGIRRVRLTRNIHPPDEPPPWSQRVSKAFWNLGLRYLYRTKTTVGCTSLKVFLRSATPSTPRMRSVELLVHPGHPDFEEETRLLSGEWWKTLPFGIQTISYLELDGPG
jgi:predicted glycoside hydrolase/deacetylase ChbG (UPF0249 family)